MADKLSSEQNDVIRTPPEQEQPPYEAEKQRGMSMLMKVALAAVVISSLIISISCVMQANWLYEQKDEIRAEIEEINEENREKLRDILREVDEQYIIDYAREKFHMFFPDEEIFYDD